MIDTMLGIDKVIQSVDQTLTQTKRNGSNDEVNDNDLSQRFYCNGLSQSAGLTLGLEEDKDITYLVKSQME